MSTQRPLVLIGGIPYQLPVNSALRVDGLGIGEDPDSLLSIKNITGSHLDARIKVRTLIGSMGAPFTSATAGIGMSFTNLNGAVAAGLYCTNSGLFRIEGIAGSYLEFSTTYVRSPQYNAVVRGSVFFPQFATDITSGNECGFYSPGAAGSNQIGVVLKRTEVARWREGGLTLGSATLTGAGLCISTVTAAGIGQIIRGVASQTGDLEQWQSSTGSILAKINAAGEFSGTVLVNASAFTGPVLSTADDTLQKALATLGKGGKSTVTIATGDWSSLTAVKTVSGITATSIIWVSPVSANWTAYGGSGIRATAQASNELTFVCETLPTDPIDVNVVWM